IAGAGAAHDIRTQLSPYGERVEFLGGISDQEKAQLFSSADLYIAPQTGGESFGIVLVEAMAGGCGVVASDIQAFRDVLDHGRAGWLFHNRDRNDLAATIIDALAHPTRIDTAHVREWCRQFDWDEVGRKIVAVYQCAVQAGGRR
ncbi:MAG: glycosyltransferase family 4 protein, partial [Bowdeniella nasicola]|nr:glycosyltransferase family 4 protein [Bowdeniella nasicola]